MCGRFTQHYTWQDLLRLYRLTGPARNLEPRYNVCPTDPVDVIVAKDGGQALASMRWGLIPRWWSKPVKELPATFNARAETVTTKPIFRDAFRRHRCIVPASGYYEWRTEHGQKQPYYISAADGPVLSIAGIWDEWRDKAAGETVASCTLVITGANAFTAQIHDRMPVLLEPDQIDPWLAAAAGTEVLKPAGEGLLRMWPVSRRVNKSGQLGDDPTLVEPLVGAESGNAQPSLI
jgi:putative SOS response-associated peptidase YedK